MGGLQQLLLWFLSVLVVNVVSDSVSFGARCPLGNELEIRYYNGSSPPSWQVVAKVDQINWVYPHYFHTPAPPNGTIPAIFRNAKLQNVSAQGTAFDCVYDSVVDGHGVYLTNMGDAYGKVTRWQQGCVIEHGEYRDYCRCSDTCQCSWEQPGRWLKAAEFVVPRG